MRWLRVAIGVVVCAFLIALVIRGVQSGIDFTVFYRAGQRFLAGEPVYQLTDGSMPFKYHPVWPIVFSALALVPEAWANAAFNAAQITCWAYSFVIWRRLLGFGPPTVTSALIVLIFALGPLGTETHWVQLNGALFLGATKVFEWTHGSQKHPALSGALSALLFSVKLNFGLLLIYCVMRSPRTLIGIAVAAIALHLGVWAGYDDRGIYREWLHVTFTQSDEQFRSPHVQGLLRVLLDCFGESGKEWWVLGLLLFLIGSIFVERRAAENTAPSAAYWLAGTFLFSPLAWWYQVLFMFPLMFFVLSGPASISERAVVFVCLGVVALTNPELLGGYFETVLQFNAHLAASIIALAVFFKVLFRPSSRSV